MRIGLIVSKLGMSGIFDKNGIRIPVTLLKSNGCWVVSKKSVEKNGYTAVQLGCGKPKVNKLSKSLRGYFSQKKVNPAKKMIEFRTSNIEKASFGDMVFVDHFKEGQYIDVTSVSIGKGFSGSMKRHNFSGMRASHGVSVSHRAHGSTGQCQDPGRVFKGKKMAGHMGNKRVTIQNLLINSINLEKGLIFVKGGVPGPKGSYVVISDAIKKSSS